MDAWEQYNVSAAGGQLPEKINAGWCSWNFFSTLGVTPALGRTFAESDDRPEAEASVMLTNSFWKRRFAGDAAIVGQKIFLNNSFGRYTLGANVSIPLRVFDRNQGEKASPLLDIGRSQKTADAAQAQVFSDVDSSYEQLRSNIELLKPYKKEYLDEALYVRETITFSYQRGVASLMDFLNAQSDYRVVQLAYLQLIGSYLMAAGQMNLAVGQEVFNGN
ncbi:TolC family protein [Tunturiibacter gelidiferens]|uniref:TolC family protein n=1 Tax=Tunturiibacter gelidiferens TaxID=3069689 RepID=UPI003D9B0B75